eukprot:5250888-Pyramimonas_sp.AAC.1
MVKSHVVVAAVVTINNKGTIYAEHYERGADRCTAAAPQAPWPKSSRALPPQVPHAHPLPLAPPTTPNLKRLWAPSPQRQRRDQNGFCKNQRESDRPRTSRERAEQPGRRRYLRLPPEAVDVAPVAVGPHLGVQ